MDNTTDRTKEQKAYLGDSVYVSYDGYEFTLYFDKGYGIQDQIILMPEVLEAFNLFVKRVKP